MTTTKIREALHQRLLGFAAFFGVGFGLLILYHTLYGYGQVVSSVGDSAAAYSSPENVMLTYSTQLTVRRAFYGHSSRHILHSSSGEEVILPGSEQVYAEGTREVHRVFYLPPSLRRGDWCLFSYIGWRPAFSLVEHTFAAPAVCFIVK